MLNTPFDPITCPKPKMFSGVTARLDDKSLRRHEICALAAIIEENDGRWSLATSTDLELTHVVTRQSCFNGISGADNVSVVGPNFFLDSLKVGRRLKERYYTIQTINESEEQTNDVKFLDPKVDVFVIDPNYECEAEVLVSYKNMLTEHGGHFMDISGLSENNLPATVRYIVTDYIDTRLAGEAGRRGLLCGTMYWILDCIKEKRMLNPTLKPLYSPWPRIKGGGVLSGTRISLSQFDPVETLQYKIMLRHLGAEVETQFTKECHLLICNNNAGKKYLKAIEWAIRVETASWIERIWKNEIDK